VTEEEETVPGELTLLLDHQEITSRISDLALGLDLREYDRYRGCFADRVEIRNPQFSPGGVPVRSCTGDDWARSVCQTQARLDYCLHTLTSPTIGVRGDEAGVTLIQQARFGHGERSYCVSGPLRLRFTRTADGWRIYRLEFTVTWSEGDSTVYAQARQAAAVSAAP
jgi:SnoaL-like domain